MKEVTVSLPDGVAAHFEDDFAFHGHASGGEYASSVLQAHQASEEKALEGLLLEGLESGEPIEATPAFWADLRADLDARVREHTRAVRQASAA